MTLNANYGHILHVVHVHEQLWCMGIARVNSHAWDKRAFEASYIPVPINPIAIALKAI